jgi:nitroimidazol reductase NimA-like FMN-containing flavoprotein (pyridoxamine 5'-phosphate oxidase superfamily)
MLIRELGEAECRDVLARVGFGRLACARDNQPYVVPIYFSYDGRYLYGFSTLGQKIEWMRSNPLVCVEIDESSSRELWMSVLVFGRYEELPDTPELAADRARAQAALHQRTTWWEYASIPGAEWKRKSGPFLPIFYRIHIEQLTGHRATPATAS